MNIQTKKDAKTAASALRRELATLNKSSAEITHSESLTLLAKALGAKNWNTLEAGLPTEALAVVHGLHLLVEELLETREHDSVATDRARLMLDHWYKSQHVVPDAPSPYPLVNEGLFDFEEAQEDSVPVAGTFQPLEGTYERLWGTASVSGARREGTELELDYAGETFVEWDGQRTVKRRGVRVWLDENQNEYLESQLVLVPRGIEYNVYEASLTVRTALVDAYLAYLEQHANCRSAVERAPREGLSRIAKTLGFALTRKEEDAVLAQFKR